jgi:hypothetical protein
MSTSQAWRRLALVFAVLVGLFTGRAEAQTLTNPDPVVVTDDWQVSQLPANWVTIESPAFDVHGHVDHVRLLDRLAAHGKTSLPKLAKDLGLPIGSKIRVYVADSAETFQQLQPGDAPYWADGTAWPGHGVIFLRHPILRGAGAKPLEQVLDHELIHILLGRAFAPQRPPHWLQEGVAQVYSGEVGPELPAQISRGLLGRSPWKLADITHRFPADPMGASLAYAQSADFIQYIQHEWGQDAIRQLVRETSAGRAFPEVITSITGMRLAELDQVWRDRLVASTPVWSAPENFEAMLWAFGGVLLLVGGYQRRRAFRRRMVEWEEEEAGLQELAYNILQRRRDRGA